MRISVLTGKRGGLGAKVIEKHITRRVNVPNAQDCKVSATTNDMFELIEGIRKVEGQLGDGEKPSSCEASSTEWAQKSLAYSNNYAKGSTIHSSDLISVRPGNGVRPERIHEFHGKTLNRQVSAFSLLSFDDFL